MILKRLKEFFKSGDEKELAKAEENFDDHMAEVEGDIADLAKLETHVRKEFDGMKGDVAKLRHEVDEVVGDKAA